jgi:glycosyltransferase involved in cell wall biosynthesis
MKIGVAGHITLAMLQPLFPSGTQLPATSSFPLIATLAERFHQRGHDIAVFGLSAEVRKTQFFAGNRIEAYICPQRRPRWQMLDFFGQERRALANAMQQSGCDVIHAHWTYEFGAAAIESGVRHVITAHDTPLAVLRFARHPYWLEKPLLAPMVVRRAKYLTAVSPYIAASLRRFLRPRSQIVVIPNGVTSEVFALHGRRRRTQTDSIIFASVLNGWSVRKNGWQLVKAFALLRSQLGHNAELWMFGNEHENGGPADVWARQRSLDAGIRFMGPLPYMECLTTLAEKVDILVHPALEEAHSMAVTEAMAMGLPVIGGKYSGGIPWNLAGGQAGMLVDVTSAKAIASGMQAMAEDANLRRRLALAGRELALAQYHIDAIVDRYEAILTRASKD